MPMKTKKRYERPQAEVVCISPFMNSYDPEGESGLVGYNSGSKLYASLGESNVSNWDDAEAGTASKSLWDE
jgi:hypothetical protein